MNRGLEIERKFLINLPDLKNLDIVEKFNIKQVYLADGKGGSQRRVRIVKTENDTFMTYTEKNFISPTIREENEWRINRNEYENLIKEAKDTAVVEKRRIKFLYKNQLFEMDIYPFSKEYAILELELEDIGQKIEFPEYINIIKEVSDDRKYSNASLSNAGTFPEN